MRYGFGASLALHALQYAASRPYGAASLVSTPPAGMPAYHGDMTPTWLAVSDS